MQKLFYCRDKKHTKRKSREKSRENVLFFVVLGFRERVRRYYTIYPLYRKIISAFYYVHSSLQKRNLIGKK